MIWKLLEDTKDSVAKKEAPQMVDKYLSNMGSFEKVTIITGASKGLGAGCARVFVEDGADVVICARGQKEGKDMAAELTTKCPGTCHFEQCDITKPEDIRRVIERTVGLHGRLDCLINNAGRHPDKRTIDDFSIEEFEDLFQLNLVSYFAACKYALPHLRKTHGSIINMGSLVGTMGQEWAATYAATKGGITALTKALAIDEARHGVRVNTVLPGVIYTPMTESFIQSAVNPQEYREYLESWQWMGRMGTPEEVGHACLFLASDEAGFITGIELNLSGGAELGYGIKLPKHRSPGLMTCKKIKERTK